jgi:hypothetical protein
MLFSSSAHNMGVYTGTTDDAVTLVQATSSVLAFVAVSSFSSYSSFSLKQVSLKMET